MADADIEERLKDKSEECLKCYQAWAKDDKDIKVREALQDAIHELRKVASRLEIELAMSERDQMAQKPLPIPSHRNSQNRNNKGDNGNSDQDQDHGNGNGNGPEIQKKPKVQRRRTAPKKAAGGNNG